MGNPVPGWYPDPTGDKSRLRYWDGSQWTDRYRNRRSTQYRGNRAQPFMVVVDNTDSDTYLYGLYVKGVNGTAKPEMVQKLLGGKISFNVFAFLSGHIYLIYRKCYREALIALSITLFLSLLPYNTPVILLWFVLGLAFYPIYRRHAKRAVAEARTQQLTETALRNLQRRGGTNLNVAILLAVLFVFIELFYLFYY